MEQLIKKIIFYENSTKIKLHNKSVEVFTFDNNEIGVAIKSIVNDNSANEPRSGHYNLKDKAIVTTYKLSLEAAQSLYLALGSELNKNIMLPELNQFKNKLNQKSK